VLREARDSLKLSIADAAKETRINAEKIEHFEAGRFKLDDTYTLGQLSSYAKFLGLDHVALLQLDAESLHSDVQMNKRYRRARTFVASNSIASGLLFGVVAIAIGSALWLVVLFFSAPKLVIFTPVEDGVTNEYSVLVTGETSSGSDVIINGEPVLVDLNGGFTHRILLAEGLNEIQITAINSLSREAREQRILIADF